MFYWSLKNNDSAKNKEKIMNNTMEKLNIIDHIISQHEKWLTKQKKEKDSLSVKIGKKVREKILFSSEVPNKIPNAINIKIENVKDVSFNCGSRKVRSVEYTIVLNVGEFGSPKTTITVSKNHRSLETGMTTNKPQWWYKDFTSSIFFIWEYLIKNIMIDFDFGLKEGDVINIPLDKELSEKMKKYRAYCAIQKSIIEMDLFNRQPSPELINIAVEGSLENFPSII
jgi:hypothetical protein